MIINLLHPPQTTAWPDKVQSLYEWNDLEGQPVHNNTTMHELNLTKESSLPPPLFSFFLHPSIPLVSPLEPSHAPAVLRSSAAVFGKINWAAGEMTSSELREEVSVCLLLLPDPSAAVVERATLSTHVHTLCSTETVHESVCDIPGTWRMWRNSVKTLGGPHACLAIYHCICASYTLICPPTWYAHTDTPLYCNTWPRKLSLTDKHLKVRRSVSWLCESVMDTNWCCTHPLEVPSETEPSEELSFLLSQSLASRLRI